MPTTLEAITHEALELPRDQRLQLAHYILSLEDAPFDPEVEQAWEDEICLRMQAVREGRATLGPWEEARARIQDKLSSCK
jgi:putative addiction module component (TIGR02574 family)